MLRIRETPRISPGQFPAELPGVKANLSVLKAEARVAGESSICLTAARLGSQKDELCHGQRGPANHMEILATAYSAKEKGGTGKNEPIFWVIPNGKGHVLTTVMGHVMGDDSTSIRCISFHTVMLRGSEWAATARVTIPIPEDFPTASQVRLSGSRE
jgi:type 1 glutamine amidotransferase